MPKIVHVPESKARVGRDLRLSKPQVSRPRTSVPFSGRFLLFPIASLLCPAASSSLPSAGEEREGDRTTIGTCWKLPKTGQKSAEGRTKVGRRLRRMDSPGHCAIGEEPPYCGITRFLLVFSGITHGAARQGGGWAALERECKRVTQFMNGHLSCNCGPSGNTIPPGPDFFHHSISSKSRRGWG